MTRERNRNRALTSPQGRAKPSLEGKADGTESRSLLPYCVLHYGKMVFMTPPLKSLLEDYFADQQKLFEDDV